MLTVVCISCKTNPSTKVKKGPGSADPNSFGGSCNQKITSAENVPGAADAVGSDVCFDYYGTTPAFAKSICQAASDITKDAFDPGSGSTYSVNPCPRQNADIGCVTEKNGSKTVQWFYRFRVGSKQVKPSTCNSGTQVDPTSYSMPASAQDPGSVATLGGQNEEELKLQNEIIRAWEGKDISSGKICVRFSSAAGRCTYFDVENGAPYHTQGSCELDYAIYDFKNPKEYSVELKCRLPTGQACKKASKYGETIIANAMGGTVFYLNSKKVINGQTINIVGEDSWASSYTIGQNLCDLIEP